MEYNDEYPTCGRTYATVRIFGLPATEVESTLGLISTQMQSASVVPPGPPNGWFLSTEGAIVSRDIRRHLDWLLDRLEPKAAALAELRSRGASVDVFCYWLSASGHGGPTLSPSQAKKLAALDLECGFDVYFPERGSG